MPADYAQVCLTCSTLLRLEWMPDSEDCPQCGSIDLAAVSRGGSEEDQWEGFTPWEDAALDFLASQPRPVRGSASRFIA